MDPRSDDKDNSAKSGIKPIADPATFIPEDSSPQADQAALDAIGKLEAEQATSRPVLEHEDTPQVVVSTPSIADTPQVVVKSIPEDADLEIIDSPVKPLFTPTPELLQEEEAEDEELEVPEEPEPKPTPILAPLPIVTPPTVTPPIVTSPPTLKVSPVPPRPTPTPIPVRVTPKIVDLPPVIAAPEPVDEPPVVDVMTPFVSEQPTVVAKDVFSKPSAQPIADVEAIEPSEAAVPLEEFNPFPKRNKSNKKLIIAIAAAVVVIGLAVAGYFVWQSMQNSTPATTPEASSGDLPSGSGSTTTDDTEASVNESATALEQAVDSISDSAYDDRALSETTLTEN